MTHCQGLNMINPKTKQGVGLITSDRGTEVMKSAQDVEAAAKVFEGGSVERVSNPRPRRVPANVQGGDMRREESGDPIEILLVEDNAGDVRLTQEALAEAKVPNRLHVVPDGIAALQFLKKEKRDADNPTPDLVLLDLNIPKMSGFEVLEQIKSDPNLRRIPVIVLTSSKADGDVLRCYSNYANAYVTKPADLNQYFSVVEIIDEFWLSTARLPGKDS